MKKFLAIILTVFMMFSIGIMTACKDNNNEDSNTRIVFDSNNALSISKYISASVDIEYGTEIMERIGSENVYTCDALITVTIKKSTNENINCYNLGVKFDLALYGTGWEFEDDDAVEKEGSQWLTVEEQLSRWGEATVTTTIIGSRSVKWYFDQGNISVLEFKPTINIYSFQAASGEIEIL